MITESEKTPVSPKKKARKKLRLLVRGSKHVGQRSVQQDAFLTSDSTLYGQRGLLAVLADGMGGMSFGERYSALATEEMVRFFEAADPDEDICQTLLAAYQAARAAALQMDEHGEGGSTVVAALVKKRRCAFLSVGDSRIYLMRSGGLIQLNREQTLGIQLDESAALGYVPPEEAQYNMYRKSLTNHLCIDEDVPCDRCLTPFLMREGDKLALMSDGVFGTLSEEEITDFMKMPGVTGADAMIEAVISKNIDRQDNCSVLILSLEAAPLKK